MTEQALPAYSSPVFDLTPRTVETFLAVTGWHLETRREGHSALWALDDDRGEASLMLPYDTSFRDFQQRFRDALSIISDVHGVTGDALGLEVASASADILLVRADQFMDDGTIPLSEAKSLILGAQKMILAAACSTIAPKPSYPGRKPKAAADFMADSVRMGHTMRGSFVLTIFARLPVEASSDAHDGTSAEEDEIVPYPRQVMSQLRSALGTLDDVASDRVALSTDEVVSSGVSAELCQSLEDMTEFEGLRSLDLSFRWSASIPAPTFNDPIERVENPNRVVLRRDQLPRVTQTRETLRTKFAPTTDTVLGQVVRLERAEGKDDGIVIVEGFVGKERRRVRVPLTGATYASAVRAHEARTPVVMSGQITREGKSYWLRHMTSFVQSDPRTVGSATSPDGEPVPEDNSASAQDRVASDQVDPGAGR